MSKLSFTPDSACINIKFENKHNTALDVVWSHFLQAGNWVQLGRHVYLSVIINFKCPKH
jgi:hypothetical protein